MGASVIESLEKERLSGIEDFIATLVSRRYLWPEMYLEQLMKVISVIGKHGRAVIAGRGANFHPSPERKSQHPGCGAHGPLRSKHFQAAEHFRR
jgi:hypothetical protein